MTARTLLSPPPVGILDAGAAGILYPRGESAAMVRQGIEAAKYAPAGKRGLGGVRANRYGTIPLGQFVRDANASTVIVVQIETAGALAELDAIGDEGLTLQV